MQTVMISWFNEGEIELYRHVIDFESPLSAGDLIRYADLMKKAETEDVSQDV